MLQKICIVVGACFLLIACKQSHKIVQPAAVGLPFYNAADFTPQWIGKGSPAYRTIHTIPPFSFIGQEGDTVTELTFAGKIYVANFFFTACPGICKQLTTNLLQVQKTFINDNRVLLISHSVTPESDDTARLRQYAKAFGIRSFKWKLVTGNRVQLYRIARKDYFADEDMGEQKSSGDFLHTENILLIDQQRRIRGVYKGTSIQDISNLIADIKTLEAEGVVRADDNLLTLQNGTWLYRKTPFNGTIETHFASGALKMSQSFFDGKEEGWQFSWYADGRRDAQRFFHKGEKEGTHSGWWPNGKPRFEYHFHNGYYEGDFKEWYETGEPLKQIVYHEGKEIMGRGWRRNGKPYMSFVVKNNRFYGQINPNLCYSLKNEQGQYIAARQ